MVANPSRARVQRGRPDAVVGRDAHHLDLVHAGRRSQSASPSPPSACPSKPEYAAAYSPLWKTASSRPVQLRVELDPAGADHAVRRPGVHVVRVVAEVRARVDVVVLGGDHVVPPVRLARAAEIAGGHPGAAGDRRASRPRRSRSARRR